MEDKVSSKPKYRQKLNAKQISTLRTLYKFRFATTDLIAKCQAVDKRVVYSRLRILADQEYIGQRYESSYNLKGKHASYFLLPKGIRFLKDQPSIDAKALHRLYYDKNANDQFIDHCLDVFSAYIRLSSNTPDIFNIYTKYELHGLSYFPSPAPDLYMSRIVPSKDRPNDYFLDIFTGPLFYVIKKRFALYIDHFDEGDWQYKTKRGYPAMLLACPNTYMENKLQNYIKDKLEDAGINELDIYTTTANALLTSYSNNSGIWTKVTLD